MHGLRRDLAWSLRNAAIAFCVESKTVPSLHSVLVPRTLMTKHLASDRRGMEVLEKQ